MAISIDDLNTLKVAEIKDFLKKLDLPTQGFKKELVDRLKEGMEAKGLKELLAEGEENEVENKEAAPVEQAAEEKQVTNAVEPQAGAVEEVGAESAATANGATENAAAEPVVAEPVVAEPAAESVVAETPAAEKKAKEPEVALTLDEIKTKVLEHITDSIARAEKFNELEKLKRLTKDKQRIEKFGISEENPIAIELGLIKAKQAPKKKFHNRRNSKNNRRPHPYKRNRK